VVAIALASIPLALFVVPRVSRAAGLPRGYFSIEVPVVLLLLSTLVFRIRGAEALSDDPLDSAAMYRLACIGGAALLGWLTLLREPAAAEPVRTPPPVFLYGAYVAVVFLGAPLSLNLPLTAYRGLELMVGLLVVVAAVQYGGRDAILRLERAVYAFLVLLILSVWAGVLLFPGEAVFRDVSPIPFQIQGLYPAVSPNGVGETGAILFLWSLGVRVSGRSVGRWNTAFITLGLVTLVAGQYRTGWRAGGAHWRSWPRPRSSRRQSGAARRSRTRRSRTCFAVRASSRPSSSRGGFTSGSRRFPSGGSHPFSARAC
jgi:hypothetical protein